MAIPDGVFTFPGLAGVRKASYTLTHGVSPSVAIVEVIPQILTSVHGTMRFLYGATAIQFPASKIISATVRKSGTGWVQVVKISDRRWRFTETGEISGVFNLRKDDEVLDANTEKTPQQIATLCFQAMHQFVFSISELPNLSRPEMILENENPAQVLSDLCDGLGCRVVLGLDNVLRIRRVGTGSGLPTKGVMSPSFSVNVPNVPDSIKVVGGKTRLQSRWTLEAVGEDTDGSIKPINGLSYTPASGWNKEWIGNYSNVLTEFGKSSHALAKKTVHRWYRITTTNFLGLVINRKQSLPIEPALFETFADDHSEIRAKNAVVRGVHWLNPNQILLFAANSSTTDLYDGSFTINTKEGVVQFSEPVVKTTQNGNNIDTDPAELTLEVSFSFQNATTKLWKRIEISRNIGSPSQGTGPLILKREDIVRTLKLNYDGNGNPISITDTFDAAQQEANSQINAKLAEFQSPQAFTADYAGLLPISLDGAIHQVSWDVGPSGAITRAGFNTEFDPAIPRFKRLREIEQQRDTIEAAKAIKRNLKKAGFRGLPGAGF